MSYADVQPTIVSLPPIVSATQPATGVLGQVWIDTAANIPKFWDGSMWKVIAATGGGGVDILGDETNVSLAGLPIQVDGGSLVYNQAANTWGMKKLMHAFPNKFSTGAAVGNTTTYLAPVNPALGDIWADKNTDPSTLREWDGTAWTPVNFATTTIPFLSSLANVHVPKNDTYVDHGAVLTFNSKSDKWEDGHAPTYFRNWNASSLFAQGEVVFYNNTFWECLKPKSVKVEPINKDGSIFLYWWETVYGKRTAHHATVPYALHVGTALGTAPTVPCPITGTLAIVNWVSDTQWEIWHNQKVVGAAPTYTVTASWQLLAPTTKKVWHNLAAPSLSTTGTDADNVAVLWVYDSGGLSGVATPIAQQTDWKPVRPENYLASLADVRATTATVGDTLVHDAQGHWVATPKWVAVPTSKTDAGVAGQMAYDSTHIFMCVAPNSWIRFSADHGGGW